MKPSFGAVAIQDSLTEYEESVVRSIQLLGITVGDYSGSVSLASLAIGCGRPVGATIERLKKKGVIEFRSGRVRLCRGFKNT